MDTNGYCKETLKYGISKEKCCAAGSSLTAYTAEELREDALFILRMFDKGVPCIPCQGKLINIVVRYTYVYIMYSQNFMVLVLHCTFHGEKGRLVFGCTGGMMVFTV